LPLAANVLGVGALFLPWTAGTADGPAAALGWLYDILAGGLVVVALACASGTDAARRTDGGILALTDIALGSLANHAVRACYAVGVTAGQTVVALVAAGLGLMAFGSAPSSASSAIFAAAVLAVAVLVAGAGWRPPPWLTYPVFGLILAVLLVAGLTGRGAVAPPDSAVPANLGRIASAAVLQLFAVVGWESAGRTGQDEGRGRIPGLLGGVAIVGLLYGVALYGTRSTIGYTATPGIVLPNLGPGWLARDFALITMLAAALFCARNVRTATELTTGLLGAGPTSTPAVRWTAAVAIGLGAMLGVVLICAMRLPATGVLAVPNAMALTVFLTAGAASAALTSGWRRWCAVAAFVVYLPLLPFAGPALVLPVMIFLACAARSVTRRAHANREPGSERRRTCRCCPAGVSISCAPRSPDRRRTNTP
jgi:hypothetical protein